MAFLTVGPNSTYPTIAAAMQAGGPGDTIQLQSGYGNETAAVTHNGVTIFGDATSIGITLQLGMGIATFTAAGTAPFDILDASDGNGIVGNAGNNLVTVTAGIDAVNGGAGVDRLVVDYRLATGAVTGDSTSNFAEAEGGGRAVTITAGTFENFTVLTGTGADTLTVGDGANVITAGNGANTITTGNGNNLVTGGVDADTITTGAGNDTIEGGAGTNTISAGQGFNIVTGGAGADTITALDGGNTIDAGNGTNHVTTGAGADTILTGTGADTIVSGAQDDLITARGGADNVDAGAGSDRLIIDYSAMTTNVLGGVVSGTLAAGFTGHIEDQQTSQVDFVGVESFVITTGSGNDRVITGGGADTLTGGAGNDTLDGGAGNDVMTGGLGDDHFLIDSAGDVVIEAEGQGTDTVWISAVAAVTISANIEIVRMYGAGSQATGTNSAEQLVANAAVASTLNGGGGDDVLWGSLLNNTMNGGGGDDIMRGQGGGGTWTGGLGNDHFVVSNLNTTLLENPGEGADTAWVSINGYTVGSNIEVIYLGGTANQVTGGATGTQIVANSLFASNLQGGGGDDVLWGSGFVDTLDGGAGNDIFRGQGGADVMRGGMGDDQYVVLDAGVSITENAAQGYDTAWIGLAANVAFTLAANVERGNLSGAANTLTGNSVGNVLVGDAVASTLNGAGGDDILFGSSFADVLTGGTGNDIFYGGGGADRFVYAGPGWGADQISLFAPGAKLDFRDSGISFGQLALTMGGGNTAVVLGGDSILVYGVSLTQSDFLFG